MNAHTWWTDGSRSDDGRVGAAAVRSDCERGGSKALRSYLRKGQMEVFDAEMWAIGMMDQQRSTSIMRSRHRDGDTRASLGMRKRINNQM